MKNDRMIPEFEIDVIKVDESRRVTKIEERVQVKYGNLNI